MIARAVTLLPEPLSPTMPSTLRAARQVDAVEGMHNTQCGRELDLEVSDGKDGVFTHRRSCHQP